MLPKPKRAEGESHLAETGNAISPLGAILAIVATFVFWLFAASAVALFLGGYVGLICSELFLTVIPLAYMLYKRVNIRSYIGLRIEAKTIVIGVIFGALLLFFDTLVLSVLVFAFGESEAVNTSNDLIRDISGSLQGMTVLVIALSLAGLCEEFTFRGFLQTAIKSKYPFGIALIVSSLAFGLFHIDIQGIYIIAAFLMGLVFGYINHHWRSYVVSAVAHTTLNLIILALMVLPVPG